MTGRQQLTAIIFGTLAALLTVVVITLGVAAESMNKRDVCAHYSRIETPEWCGR